ncbi:MAG: peptidoglycan bridge formation glycyltransferase FemA/FemB family protein [Parcubacteria group bacterium]
MQKNRVDRDFLQSEEWRKFQEATGKKTFNISTDGFWANIIEHQLPIVGKYFYVPRGPLGEVKMEDVINLAKKEKANWIRIDVDYKNSKYKIEKAPHDMQPREVFIIDITKSEEELLAQMKSKTRYNIKVAQKHNVKISVADKSQPDSQKYLENLLELVKITAKRDGITPHPENYYRQMFEIIPAENLKLYVAEYENKIIAANIVIFYGNIATYLHGASDNEHRNVMAPHLLQWQQIQDAKKAGLKKYDFGGICSGPTALDQNDLKRSDRYNAWAGITKFKTGFSPNTKPILFPGSYDIIINKKKYYLYRLIQKIKGICRH